MKKLLSLTVALVLVFSLCTYFSTLAEEYITVTVDGKEITFDVQPRLIGGRTMVPLRAIFEAIGATVEWNDATQTVTAYNEAYIVKCTIDSHTIYVNNESRSMDVAPMMIDSRTLVPARFVAEAFNCDVNWDSNTFVVTITTNPIDYSKVEQGTNNTNPSGTTEQDSAYEPQNSRYYPGTDVPDYTYITGIEQKISPYYGENGWVIYTYKYTKSGEYSEVIDYIAYLEKNGWSEYSYDNESDSLRWFFVTDKDVDDCVGISYHARYDEITVGVKRH